MRYTYIPDAPENERFYRESKHIRRKTAAIAEERLEFLDGTPIGAVDIFIESGETVRKVRRIIEKRVCQDMHRTGRGRRHADAYYQYNGKHRVTNQMKNIYGRVPKGFQYCCAA